MLFSTFTSLFITLLALLMPMTSVSARAIPYPMHRELAKRTPAPEDVNLVPAEAAVRGIGGIIEVIEEKRSEDIEKRQVNNVDLIAPSMSKNGQIVPFVNNGKREVPRERRSRLFAGLRHPKGLQQERQERDALPEGLERRALDGAIVNKMSTSRATRSRNGVIEYI